MNHYQRPWWVLAMRMPALDTQLREAHQPDEKRFIIEGQPVLRSLAWVTYGPGLAVITVLLLGWLAWTYDIRSQPTNSKMLVVCGMILFPLIAWGVGGSLINRLMAYFLAQEMATGQQQVVITLQLLTKTLQFNQSTAIPFAEISGFRLISDAGVYYSPESENHALMNLVMETEQGQVTLLPKTLGSTHQKRQLQSQLAAIIGLGPVDKS